VEYALIETSQTIHAPDAERGSTRGAVPTSARMAGDDPEFPLDLRATTFAELCESAVGEVAARFPDRRIEYTPDPELEGAGEWDPRRVTYALTILLEDALKRTSGDEAVSVRWREHGEGVVARVQYARPLERGDRFVTYFEEGVRPDGADDSVGTLRIVAALKIARQHRGRLARIRTWAGTAYVLELPRSASAEALDDAPPAEDGR